MEEIKEKREETAPKTFPSATKENQSYWDSRTMPAAAPQTLSLSYFDGNTWQLLGWRLLGLLLSAITAGLAYPWAQCMIYRWETRHTISGNHRLYFDGKGHQLLGKLLLWGLLTVVTLGIYAIFIPVNMRKWRASHTRFATLQEEPMGLSGQQVTGAILGIISVVAVIALVVMLLTGGNAFGEGAEATAPGASTQGTTETSVGTTAASEPTAGTTLPEGDVYYVIAPKGLNIREQSSTSSEVLGVIPYGTAIVPLQMGEYWALVEYEGITGWCSTGYLVTYRPVADPGTITQ